MPPSSRELNKVQAKQVDRQHIASRGKITPAKAWALACFTSADRGGRHERRCRSSPPVWRATALLESTCKVSSISWAKNRNSQSQLVLYQWTLGSCVLLSETDPYALYFSSTQFCLHPSKPRANFACQHSHFKTLQDSHNDVLYSLL